MCLSVDVNLNMFQHIFGLSQEYGSLYMKQLSLVLAREVNKDCVVLLEQ